MCRERPAPKRFLGQGGGSGRHRRPRRPLRRGRRCIYHSRRPRRVEIVDCCPFNATGKVLRYELRALLANKTRDYRMLGGKGSARKTHVVSRRLINQVPPSSRYSSRYSTIIDGGSSLAGISVPPEVSKTVVCDHPRA